MAQVSKGYKKSYLFLIISGLLIVLAGVIFALAYGLSRGWDYVASWFTSDDAIFAYILVGSYVIFATIFIVREKLKKMW